MHTHKEIHVTVPIYSIPEPSITSLEVTRLNMTTFNLSVSLAYTGGGAITHFRVSFRDTGTTPWSPLEDLPATPSPNSNLVWNGIVSSNEFATYSQVEFMLNVINQRGFVSNSMQIEVELGKSNTILDTVCATCVYS